MNLESAELVKHGINSFLAMSIVFADQLSDICDQNNADIKSVVNGIKSDSEIGKKAYLNSSIGFFRWYFRKRPKKILQSKIIDIDYYDNNNIFKSVYNQNKRRKEIIVSKIEKNIFPIEGKNIGVLGLTYKPGTSTLRRSLPVEICDLLILKHASISVYDPKADFKDLNDIVMVVSDIDTLSKNIDLLILTEWKEFLDFNWANIVSNMRKNYFFDPKKSLNKANMVKAGGLIIFHRGKKYVR